jgi:hypothetical protein
VLVLASRQNSLSLQPDTVGRVHPVQKSPCQRDADINARDARAPQAKDNRFKALLLVVKGTMSEIWPMDSDLTDEILTYWLIPAEPALSYFRSLICELAERFDGPVFGPHVTLYTTNSDKKIRRQFSSAPLRIAIPIVFPSPESISRMNLPRRFSFSSGLTPH